MEPTHAIAGTFEFLGQLIACERDEDETKYQTCLESLSEILAGSQTGLPIDPQTPASQSAVNAFKYWLRAIELDLPEPTPSHVNLANADLYGWRIQGRSSQRRINLVNANLNGCNLRGQVRLKMSTCPRPIYLAFKLSLRNSSQSGPAV